jgi:hypothetical protein
MHSRKMTLTTFSPLAHVCGDQVLHRCTRNGPMSQCTNEIPLAHYPRACVFSSD